MILLLGASPAAAQDAELTCAALWTGYGDFASVSAYLDTGDADQQAEGFRKMAIEAGSSTQDADREIAAQSGGMFLLVRAMIESGDRLSRDLFQRQMQTCDALIPSDEG